MALTTNPTCAPQMVLASDDPSSPTAAELAGEEPATNFQTDRRASAPMRGGCSPRVEEEGRVPSQTRLGARGVEELDERKPHVPLEGAVEVGSAGHRPQ
eukprot:scaffold8777_cov130-Isochrysis_galbana.AAC.2